MRITGGTAGGRRLRVPGADVRPSQDRLRESLFSMLAPVLQNARVLDLYAGSGGLGLEAWSRGAQSVCWVERSRRVLPILQENIRNICGEAQANLRCMAGDARRLDRVAAYGPFTLVLADPPYALARDGELVKTLLQGLAGRAMVSPGGCVVVEQAADTPAPETPDWRCIRDRTIGDSRLIIYRAAENPDGRTA